MSTAAKLIPVVIGRVETPCLVFNGSNTSVNCGSDAGLDDLADNAFTAECWFLYKALGGGGGNILVGKSNGGAVGWMFYVDNGLIRGRVYCNDNTIFSTKTVAADNLWHHAAITFDDAGDRKVRLFVDGIVQTASNAGSGVIKSDAAVSLFLGQYGNANLYHNGYMGWTRISNVVRYTVNFDPPPRWSPPAMDANTIAQWNMTEMTGSTLDNAEGTAGRDGTVSNGAWLKA